MITKVVILVQFPYHCKFNNSTDVNNISFIQICVNNMDKFIEVQTAQLLMDNWELAVLHIYLTNSTIPWILFNIIKTNDGFFQSCILPWLCWIWELFKTKLVLYTGYKPYTVYTATRSRCKINRSLWTYKLLFWYFIKYIETVIAWGRYYNLYNLFEYYKNIFK